MSATYLDLSSQGILQQKSAVVSGNVPYGIVALTSGGVIHTSLLPESTHTSLVVQDTATTTLSGIHTIVVASGDASLLSNGVVRIQTASDVPEGNNQGPDVSDGDKGDIVVVSGQWLIKNQAVTTSKLQLFSPSSLLGTTTSGTVTGIIVGSGLVLSSGVLSTAVNEWQLDLPTSGLLNHWTASYNVQTDSEMRVTQWDPVIGSAALTQSNASSRPVYLYYNQYPAVCFPIRRSTALLSSFLPPTGQQPRSFAFLYVPFLHVLNWIGGLFSYGTLSSNAGFGFITHIDYALSYAVDFVGSRVFVPITTALPASCVVAYSNDTVTVVMNGHVVLRQNVASFNLNTGTNIPFQVGIAFAGVNEATTGLLFELAVWNVALTEEQAVNVSTQFMRRYSNLF